jgi:hypothetical protein
MSDEKFKVLCITTMVTIIVVAILFARSFEQYCNTKICEKCKSQIVSIKQK